MILVMLVLKAERVALCGVMVEGCFCIYDYTKFRKGTIRITYYDICLYK